MIYGSIHEDEVDGTYYITLHAHITSNPPDWAPQQLASKPLLFGPMALDSHIYFSFIFIFYLSTIQIE